VVSTRGTVLPEGHALTRHMNVRSMKNTMREKVRGGKGQCEVFCRKFEHKCEAYRRRQFADLLSHTTMFLRQSLMIVNGTKDPGPVDAFLQSAGEGRVHNEYSKRWCPKPARSFVVSVNCVTKRETHVSTMYHNLGARCRRRECKRRARYLHRAKASFEERFKEARTQR
jgi:hypothetical protein